MCNKPYWYCEKLWTHLISLGITLIIGCALVTHSLACNVSITWDPSPGPDVAGYVIDHGMQSGNYEHEVDVGNVMEFTLTSLNDETTYYIAVRAYDWSGQFSDYSNEVVFNGSSNPGADVYSIPHIEMSLVRVDSEELQGEDGRGENAIDGDPSSLWHTEWYYANTVHPHEIVIDLGYDRQVCGFSYLPRQDDAYNGGIAAYELYVSTDDQNWGNPVATGEFLRTSDKQEVAFDARHARYVRLVALSEVAGHAWTSAAEIEVMEQIGGYVNETPEAIIKADVTSGFAPVTVTFDAGGSSDSDGDIVEYRWDFGDGESGTGVTTLHDFMTSGTYSVTLTVVDNEGATAQAQVAITVNDTPNENPEAVIEADLTSGFAPVTVTFDAYGSSDSDGYVVEYRWDFGDGESGTGVTTLHDFMTSGTYSVTLTVVDNEGATAQTQVAITVNDTPNENPEAVIKADVTSGFAPVTVTFDAGGSNDSDGYVVEYRWDFGDGESGTGITIPHDFMTSGTYSVTLTVVDNEGATAQAQVAITVNDTLVEVTGIPYWEMSLVRVDSEELLGEDGRGENAIDGDPSSIWHTEWYYANTVHPHAIVIDLGYDRQVCGFSYLPRQDDAYNGGIAAYELYVSTDDQNWGNPVATGVFPRTSDKQEVAFAARHARYVRLVALSEVAGHAWTSAAEIEVMEQIGGYVNENPEAVIKADVTSGFAPVTVTFDAGGSNDSDGYVVEYRWDFGDGESGTGATVPHDFMTSGTYSVTLTVVDNEGATAQAQVAITVNDTLVEVTGIPYWEMSLVRVDSEELRSEDGRGENAIDGDPSSIWHTEWYYSKRYYSNTVHPHEIVIDLGYDRQVCGFSYLPRQDDAYNGGIAAYELYVSTDDQNWGNPVATGVFPRTSDKQEVAFAARHARYVRLVALSEVAGLAWTSAAEIEVMELR